MDFMINAPDSGETSPLNEQRRLTENIIAYHVDGKGTIALKIGDTLTISEYYAKEDCVLIQELQWWYTYTYIKAISIKI